MNVIPNRLVHFARKSDFKTEVANNNILDESIVFIKDSGEIYTHQSPYRSVKWGEINPAEGDIAFSINEAGTSKTLDVVGDTSWIKGRRCLAKQIDAGVAICYLDEDNSNYFHDGTVAALDGSMGEFMVDLPENYVTSIHSTEDLVGVIVSNTSGKTTFRRVLVGAVHGIIDSDGKLRSIVDGVTAPTTNKNIFEFHDAAVNNGEGWDIMDYETRNKITILAYAKHGNLDLQAVYGLGDTKSCFIEGETANIGNYENVELSITDMHSTLGVENFFNNVRDFMGGVCTKGTNVYIFDGLPTEIPENARVVKLNAEVSGTIAKMKWGEYADLIPVSTVVTGVYSDFGYISDMADIQYVVCGGYYADSNDGGARFYAYCSASGAYSSIGSRLQYRGDITVIEDPEEFKLL